jgi:hypothetical protein
MLLLRAHTQVKFSELTLSGLYSGQQGFERRKFAFVNRRRRAGKQWGKVDKFRTRQPDPQRLKDFQSLSAATWLLCCRFPANLR